MSISENIGVIHTKIRRRIANTIERVKNNHKKIYLIKASLFDDFGIDYYGCVNEHDYKELIKYLNIQKIKKIL